MDEAAWRRRICGRVREVRRRLNLSQMEFALLADLSLHTVNKIERGEAFPDLRTLLRLAEAHRVPFTEFFDPEPPAPSRKSRLLRDLMSILKTCDERTLEFTGGLVRYVARWRERG
jgi:transcriptional regulator with XRE-family HTH domain